MIRPHWAWHGKARLSDAARRATIGPFGHVMHIRYSRALMTCCPALRYQGGKRVHNADQVVAKRPGDIVGMVNLGH
jgi:hypothetical protein